MKKLNITVISIVLVIAMLTACSVNVKKAENVKPVSISSLAGNEEISTTTETTEETTGVLEENTTAASTTQESNNEETATGTDIDKIMPPVSRFGQSNRNTLKQRIIDALQKFFDKYFGLV